MWNDFTFPHAYKLLRTESSKGEQPRLEYGRHGRVVAAAVAGALILGLCALEVRSSWLESSVLPSLARRERFALRPGPSRNVVRSLDGPYDERLGMAHLPELIRHLGSHGFVVAEQAQDSRTAQVLSSLGVEPLYPEKSQAGLLILDRQGQPLYQALYPRQVYQSYHSIPPLVVQTLLFIENREMLDFSHPRRNPSLQWGRLSRAVADLAIHTVDHGHPIIGGSTLSTQLVKLRHSPDGRTSSVIEKARQVASASLRAYQDGPNTVREQQQIICDYINSIPLAATGRDGEVIGLADGLRAWYGVDPAAVNRLLTGTQPRLYAQQAARARAYREALSLLLALHAPTRELVDHPDALHARVNRYLRLLAAEGVIPPALRDLALRAHTPLRAAGAEKNTASFIANKAPDAIRLALLPDLGLDNLYALDRLDVTVRTALDKRSQESVSSFLNSLGDQKAVQAAGLSGYQLLGEGKPGPVIYSVTLYERGQRANLLRVQTDNYNQPLDINQGSRLQLGSTAKLRTLVNYLQIVEALHTQYAAQTPAQLKAVQLLPGDNLTAWAVGYLSAATDKRLEPMLRAALQRKYSGNPGEAFFTAGGLHHFDNFEKSEDGRFFTVADAFQNSVNLAFIRVMRDIERYYMFRVPGASPSVLSDQNNPARRRYLDRFADYEGRTFLRRFYEKYQGQSPDQAFETLLSGIHLTPLRAAVIFRSVRPTAGISQFTTFLESHFAHSLTAQDNPEEFYSKYGPDKFDLADRGYLARVHPLELWLLSYREQHPQASLAEVFEKSAAQRQEVYTWLLKTRYKHAQDKRIETILEMDAFREIHRSWKQLGYPFDSLTPSYATCIGVSGDTPQALSDLVGILLNNGIRYPTVRVGQLDFFHGTPFETVVAPHPQPGGRVLSPVIARLVREQMIGVVQNGTGRRASGGMHLADGRVLAIGGKTGTGDNRLEQFNAHGGVIASRVVNRTAAFVFFIGDRLYGTILAFVPGQAAGGYNFTSALAVQLLKDLEPRIAAMATGTPNASRTTQQLASNLR